MSALIINITRKKLTKYIMFIKEKNTHLLQCVECFFKCFGMAFPAQVSYQPIIGSTSSVDGVFVYFLFLFFCYKIYNLLGRV